MLRSSNKQAGFTLVEIAIVVAVIAVMAALAIPQFSSWTSQQRLRGAARSLADALTYARAEAMRSGNNHIVFYRVNGVATQDSAGNNIALETGADVAVLVIDDGRPGTGNCQIDAGEPRLSVPFVQGVNWGSTFANVKVPQDSTAPVLANAITFQDPEVPGTPRVWIMFRPDGIPVSYKGNLANCDTVGDTGSGGGGIYVTDGTRDYAAVMSPLGSVRLYAWDPGNAQWTN